MAAYWEIAAHSAYNMFSRYKYLIVNLLFFFPPRFLECEFLSDCAFSRSLPTCTSFFNVIIQRYHQFKFRVFVSILKLFEPPHGKTNNLPIKAKTKAQISFAVTAKLIRAFVFATRIVQFLFYLNPKFQASSSFLCLYRPVCDGPVWKPHCWFSHEAAHLFQCRSCNKHTLAVF